MLHFASYIRDIGKYQEYKLTIDRYKDGSIHRSPIGNGTLRVPTGPGVGIRVQPYSGWLERAGYRHSTTNHTNHTNGPEEEKSGGRKTWIER